MTVLNGIRNLFVHSPLPELGIREISRLGAERTGSRSIAIPFDAMANLAFVAVKFFPLGVFVRLGGFGFYSERSSLSR